MNRSLWHPPDPVGASQSALTSVRAALRRYDPALGVWWSPNRGYKTGMPGRWRIVRYVGGDGGWATEFYWEGPHGEYRPLHLEPILLGVRRKQWVLRQGIRALAAQIDRQNELAQNNRLRGLEDIKNQRLAEVMPLARGRQVFAPGYIRPRNFNLPIKRNWAAAMANPALYDTLDDYDKAIVDHMRKTGYEP